MQIMLEAKQRKCSFHLRLALVYIRVGLYIKCLFIARLTVIKI